MTEKEKIEKEMISGKEYLISMKFLLDSIIEERVKFLSYVQYIDEECSFPLSEEILREKAIEELIKEVKVPPFYREL